MTDKQVSLLVVLPRWWRVARLYFTGAERWKARGYAAAVVVLAVLSTLFYVKISYAQKDFSTTMAGKDVPGFYRSVADFAVIICIAAPFFSFTLWLEERLVLSWRAHLTQTFLTLYFKDNAYFSIKQADNSGLDGGPLDTSSADSGAALDNPDQRICDDISGFVRASTDIILALIKKILNCAAFAGVLWGISKPLVAFMFGYAILATFLTTAVFGQVLATLYNKLLRQEGDLRFSLVRVSLMAESIAFYDGTQAEARWVYGRFGSVLQTLRDRIRWSALFDLWTRVYDYATILAPSMITAPRYFRGEIEFGTISQASFAFSSISSALSVIIFNLTAIAGLAAQAERLDCLLTALTRQHEIEEEGAGKKDYTHPTLPLGNPASSTSPGRGLSHQISGRRDIPVAIKPASSGGLIARHVSPSLGLQLSDLTVLLPSGRHAICEHLDLLVQPGESLLIVGPSGVGKSSLLRALSGLWKRGAGSVHMPQSVFFLPQKPFMPHMGTLRQQLLFPSGRAAGQVGLGVVESHTLQDRHTSGGRAAQSLSSLRRRNSDGEAVGGPLRDVVELAPLLGGGGLEGPESLTQQQQGQQWGLRPAVTDEELLERLAEVHLGGLAEQVGGLDAECDWATTLSPGQQQRVAILRLLLHQPDLAFLDEATSALDHVTESHLYQLVRSRVNCVVSVGHRTQLFQHHTHVLEGKPQADGTTAWIHYPSPQYTQSRTAGQ